MVNRRREQYSAALGREISYAAAEEVVCNSLGRLLGNERVMEELAGKHRRLFSRIWRSVVDFFKKLLRKMRGMDGDFSAKSTEQRIVEGGTLRARRRLEDAFVKALRSANATGKASYELTRDKTTDGSNEAKKAEKADVTTTDESKAAENAKKTPVTITNEQNVKVTDGAKWSLCEFSDGKRFVIVETEQDRFDGLSLKEQTDLATKIIKSRFKGKVIGIDNKAFVNGVTANEYTHPSKHIDDDLYSAKMRASTELDNLMDAGSNFRTSADGLDGHIHASAVGGFGYFDVIFKVADEYYKGVINIENNRKGKRLKDVTKIENITKDVTSQYGNNPTYAFLRDASTIIIPDSETKSNPSEEKSLESEKFSLSDSEYLAAVKSGDMETAQAMIDEAARAAGYAVKAYHGTPDARATDEFWNKRKNSIFTVFDSSKSFSDNVEGKAHYFTDNIRLAKFYAPDVTERSWNQNRKPRVYSTYLNLGNKLVVNGGGASWRRIPIPKEMPRRTTRGIDGKIYTFDYAPTKYFTEYARVNGYDSVIFTDIIDGDEDRIDFRGDVYALFDPARIKSADPVTYDDNGEVIPLSERFTADNEDIRWSLSESFHNELLEWFENTTGEERAKSGKRFLVGTTTKVLRSIDFKNTKIYFGGSKINKILRDNDSMSLSTITKAIYLLDDPILIMESKTVNDSIVLFGEVYTESDKPVMISLLINPKTKNGEILDYAVITSAYGRRKGNLQNLINRSRIYYVNENKERTDTWLKALGLQLPSALTSYGSIDSILDNPPKVNINDENSSEKIETKKFSLRDRLDREVLAEAFYKIAETDAEREIVTKYRAEIDNIDEKINERRKLISRFNELEGVEDAIAERTRLNERIRSVTEYITRRDTRLFELEAMKPFRDMVDRYEQNIARPARNTRPGEIVMSRGRYNALMANIKHDKVYRKQDAAVIEDKIHILPLIRAVFLFKLTENKNISPNLLTSICCMIII